jgi:hypothetical protein
MKRGFAFISTNYNIANQSIYIISDNINSKSTQ